MRRLVVAQGGRVALVGVAVGVLVSVGLTRYVESLLFGVEPLDAPTFAGVSVLMLAVALIASYVPARRASQVDPGGGASGRIGIPAPARVRVG